jgi:hypothetical protein
MVVRMYKTELQVASQITVLSTFSPLIGFDRLFWSSAIELTSETASPST